MQLCQRFWGLEGVDGGQGNPESESGHSGPAGGEEAGPGASWWELGSWGHAWSNVRTRGWALLLGSLFQLFIIM